VKILHKYVLKEHVGPLVFAMSALTSLLLLQYIAKRFGELVGKGLPWSVISEFLVLSIPLTVALSLPMAVLVATLYAFSRLAAENEITAIKASGVSLRAVMAPVLVAAAGVTIFMVVFNDQVLPRANHKLRTLQGDIAQKKPTFGLREQVINEVSPGKLYLRAARLSKTTTAMRDVTIYDVGDYTLRRTIYADSGSMAVSPDQADLLLTLYSGIVQDVPTATPVQLRRLYFDTQLIRVRGVGNEFRKTSNDTFKGEREMSVCEMERNSRVAHREFVAARRLFREKLALARKRNVKLSKEALATRTTEPLNVGIGRAYCSLLQMTGVKELSAQTPAVDSLKARKDSVRKATGPLRTSPTRAGAAGVASPSSTVRSGSAAAKAPSEALLNPAPAAPPAAAPAPQAVPKEIVSAQVEEARLRVTDALRSMNRYDVEIQKKFALAAACFIFVLLGAPIALRFPRGGVGLTIGVSLVVFGIYYVGLIAGESLARRGYVPPFVSMWIANVVFGLIAVVLLARMGRPTGSSSEGDLREVWDKVRHTLGRRPAKAAAPRSFPRTRSS
jgi:lipopolysaccharide export system permease protein